MNDLISRQAGRMNNQQAINLLKDLEQCLDDYCELNDEGKTAFGMAITALELFGNTEQLPSAQPEKEKAKRVLWTGWKGCRDTRYKCPNCKKPVKNDDIYCHRCGQKLMFPRISFTDYIPGEKQELIVRWDDERFNH